MEDANDCQYQVHVSQVIYHYNLAAMRCELLQYVLFVEINSLCIQKNDNGIRPELKDSKFV